MTRNILPEPWAFDLPADLKIVDVRTAEKLARHEDAWAELLLQSPAASPMLSYPQISAFFETQVAPPEAWLCLFAYEGKRLLGVMPLIAARSIGGLGFSILLLKTPYDILHTGSVDCLTLPGREKILECFMNYLARIPRTWPLVRIREIPDHSASMICLDRKDTRIRAVRWRSASENFIEIPTDFGNYHAGLSSNFRRQLKRGKRKLEESQDVRFLCRENKRSTEENMRRFEQVEDAGWKGAENSSIRAVEANSRLYAFAAERFHDHGWMEWNFIEADGKTIGAHYAVRVKRTLFLLKICYDEDYSACSPGNLLLEKVVEHAARTGDVDEINCVADCAWHRNWAMKKRLLHDVIILPKVPLLSGLVSKALNLEIFRKHFERPTWKPQSL